MSENHRKAMSGERTEIPKEDNYNYYGDSERHVEIRALRDHVKFIRVSSKDLPRDEACIDGAFAYTTKQKSLKAGRAKTDAYVDGRRRLDARFCAKGQQGDSVETLLSHRRNYRV